ncbi:MAG: ribosome biogenesis GTPase Der [Kistimonas sp.]|nr:ribosome biogenesis GTPase Der [Kistimonas sp.]
MFPVIALVGQPNVGKSTLFNKMTRSRDALVADIPGLTRDRQYGRGALGEQGFIVVDTGGLQEGQRGMEASVVAQTMAAVEEADAVLFVVDASTGLTAADEELARSLRRQRGESLWLVLNKTDKIDEATAAAEFSRLGLGEPLAVAAAHNRGIRQLVEHVLEQLPSQEAPPPAPQQDGICLAVLGRPNVGKSTLVNRMLGEERVLVYDQAGTTRDSIRIPFKRQDTDYTLIDTAGVRRRGRVRELPEKFSVIKALQAMEEANIVILVLDAREGIVDQDLHLLGNTLDAGRGLVIAVNKWDGMTADDRTRVRQELRRRLSFIDFAEIHFISALHGTNVGHLFASVEKAWRSAQIRCSSSQLTRMLSEAVTSHPPPLVRGRRIKLRYCHMSGNNPPSLIVHGNQTDAIPASYTRYLENSFRRALKLTGTPLRVTFRTADNPYADKSRGQHKPVSRRNAPTSAGTQRKLRSRARPPEPVR